MKKKIIDEEHILGSVLLLLRMDTILSYPISQKDEGRQSIKCVKHKQLEYETTHSICQDLTCNRFYSSLDL